MVRRYFSQPHVRIKGRHVRLRSHEAAACATARRDRHLDVPQELVLARNHGYIAAGHIAALRLSIFAHGGILHDCRYVPLHPQILAFNLVTFLTN